MSIISVSPFSQRCIEFINEHINKELTASYAYYMLSIHFNRHTIALTNVANYFRHASDEEREHADKFIACMQQRGGGVVLKEIKPYIVPSAITLLEAFAKALEMEKEVLQSIMALHTLANQEGDAHITSFLEDEFIDEQVKEEDKYMRIITILKRMGSGLGEQLFDKEIIANFQ